ncbi:MAG: Dabb family protein [Planctomycetales bacterium]|nr:Dabb family protein [Planctomycetales bacterium]
MTCCARFNKYSAFSLIFFLLAGAVVMSSFAHSAADTPEKTLRHVVMFDFKEDATKQDIQKVVDAFRELPSKIPQIADFEYGTDNSPEGLANGFTHCFLVSFKSEEDRKVYLPHAAHQAFVEVLKPHLEKVMVIDYWASK